MIRIQLIIWTLITSMLLIFGFFKEIPFIIALSIFILLLLIIHIVKIKIKINKSLNIYIPEFENNYKKILNEKKYIDNKKEIFQINKNITSIDRNIHNLKTYLKYTTDSVLVEKIKELNNFIDIYNSEIEIVNTSYYKNQLEVNWILFDSIEKYPLDEMQKKAILTPEKNLLVIAWAWSWKTSTIIWKVKHLLEVRKVNKEEILLISFTSASAQEMKTRIKEKLSLDLDVMTFHKLWKNILEKNIKN